MSESEKRIAPFGLRIPPDLKERVQQAAESGNQSMNALILTVLEQAFPYPTVDLREVGMLLNSLTNEAQREGQEGATFEQINKGLASLADPWSVAYQDGRIVFYPFAKRPPGSESPMEMAK